MKKQLQLLCGMFPVLLLLPYLITILCNDSYTALRNRKFEFEMCVPVLTESQISSGQKKEIIKARTIIARTNLYARILDGEKKADIFRDIRNIFLLRFKRNSFAEKIWLYKKLYIFEQAAKATEYKVLSYEEQLYPVSYPEQKADSFEKSDKTCDEILEELFPEMQVKNIEDFEIVF